MPISCKQMNLSLMLELVALHQQVGIMLPHEGLQHERTVNGRAGRMPSGGKAPAKVQQAGACPTNITWQHGAVGRTSKQKLLKQRGCVVW